MSRTTTAARRIALLSTSSLGLAVMASAGAMLAPGAALAQTATCAATTTVTGNGTAAVTIAGGTNNPGISCVYTGDTATVTTLGPITVSSTAPANIPLNGVNLTATGTSDINWTSTAGTVTGGSQTNGPVIEALTEQGNITLSTAGVTGSAATVTDGIRAVSSGGGNVSVTTGGTVSGTNATTGQAGIFASASGGDGDINITGIGTGRLYGIRAQAANAGTVTITGLGSVRTSTAATSAAIDVTTGTGLLTITGSADAGVGTGYRINAGGDVIINNTGQSRGLNWAMDLTTLPGRTTTINNTSSIRGYNGNSSAVVWGDAIRAQGGAIVINNSGALEGRVDFSAAGAADINILSGGRWRHMDNTSLFGSAADRVDIALGGALVIDRATGAPTAPAIIDFGAGAAVDTLTNAGTISVDRELQLLGLEEFHHSGQIILGVAGGGENFHLGTNLQYRDILSMPGAHYVGGGGTILMDVNLGGGAQPSCSSSLRDADSLMPAADCIDITGGSTEGETILRLTDLLPGDRGRYIPDGIVLVDVSGGTSAAGDFVLDPTTQGYSTAFGGIIDKGVFIYSLTYDPDAQQHKLVSLPGPNALQFPLIAAAAHGLWRLSTGTWLTRQADLRSNVEPGLGGGMWLRASGEASDRDVVQVWETPGGPFSFDNTHEQSSYAVTGGLDLVTGGTGDTAYVLGLMAGYAHSEVEYDTSANTQRFDGWTGGAYASLISGGLFVDAALNANNVILDNDVPGLGLLPEGTIISSRLVSIGGQVEAGWRLPLMGTLFLEPLASVSYVRSTFDNVMIVPDDASRPGIEVSYDDPTSLRAGLGGRLGMDGRFGSMRTQLSVLGRVWNEFEGENTAALGTTAFPDDAPAVMIDDFSGQFNEFAVGASIWSPGGIVSGFANFGGKFGDDYSSRNLAAGVRVNW